MDILVDELGITPQYLKRTGRDGRFIALVHKQWLISLFKHYNLVEFIENSRLEAWTPGEDVDSGWTQIFISTLRKHDGKVTGLPRIRPTTVNNNSLLFAQLMQYVSQSNYKNLWKEAYNNYRISDNDSNESAISLVNYNEVLREIVLRLYGCMIINTLDSTSYMDGSKEYDLPLNVLPAFCAVETLNAIVILHIPYFKHNLADCLTFSPAVLDNCYSKPLFIIYQLLNLLKNLHDRSLTLGEITLQDIYLNEDLWIYTFPDISSNICIPKRQTEKPRPSMFRDCRKFDHKFDSNSMKCEYCGLKTFDKLQTGNESLKELCQLWIDRKISNFTYISALNKFSGRKLGDPNCHHVFPWVTDFASKCGKNWRDLKKSKYRLNKGDRQLDLTYHNYQNQVPHHVSDVLSAITYYVYTARRTPKSILCKNVRTIWVPAEYPSSIQRLQQWTPDECIPEFFTDPTVFKSIHDDLEDLDVPIWASSPEDFIIKHREALESEHVSERLHHWIDLTFGYKLSGSAAVKAKNVCLHLADDHKYLTKSGIVQLFHHPHPSRLSNNAGISKKPPKLHDSVNEQRSRERSNKTSEAETKSDEEYEEPNHGLSGLTKIMSRSRSSLNDEKKQNKSPNSSARSASLGPKNPSFTSHVSNKLKPNNQNSSSSTNIFNSCLTLPKDYKPESLLDSLEKKHNFIAKTFYSDSQQSIKIEKQVIKNEAETSSVQNAFTNFMYSENFGIRTRATKSFTFPMDNYSLEDQNLMEKLPERVHQAVFNYSEVISARRVKELQVLGCLIVEIFLSKQLRALGSNVLNVDFSERLKTCLSASISCQKDLPACVRYIVRLLLQPDVKRFKSYPCVTNFGLPPPSAHLLLEPLLQCVIPFPKPFPDLYKILSSLKEFKNASLDLDILYHFDCDGSKCAEYENLERTKILLAQNVAECKVKMCAKQLEQFLDSINPNTDMESVDILLPYIKELIEDPPTSVLAAWYLFDPVARICGPKKSEECLLESILKLYEQEISEQVLPYNGKIAKIYHHSFLLRLIVRLGLKCFLDNFVTPLVEAVGGYKDFDKLDFPLHTHNAKVLRKTSHLRNLEDNVEFQGEDSEKSIKCPLENLSRSKAEEIFELDEERESENQMKSLMEHLELNIAGDLPFNVSTAEEALDATLPESIEHLKNLEELNLHLNEDVDETSQVVTSPTIPIPSTRQGNVINISCEVGSRKSDTDSLQEKKSINSQTDDLNIDSQAQVSKIKRTQIKISDMSCDSIIWLSHRLGPVLMARHLSRNLLKMLTLCYVGKENLQFSQQVEETDMKSCTFYISIASSKVVGDDNAHNVLECLASISALYGEKLILFQYLPHMAELVALCKRKLTQTLEGGLISCLVLLKYIIPYLSDATLMDQLQDILSDVLHPTVRLLGSTKYVFPSGFGARNVLARKYLDILYVISIRIGSDMTRKYLAVPALQRFFYIFNKAFMERASDTSTSNVDFSFGGKPIPIPVARLKDSDSLDSLSPTHGVYDEENIQTMALGEIRQVFTTELAHIAYLPFLKHIGANSLDISLKNHEKIRELCQSWELELLRSQQIHTKMKLADVNASKTVTASGSIGSNINIIGNRIDVLAEPPQNQSATDLLSLVSNRMENSTRHLKGNWFSYWAHEVGRSDKDTTFNFNQIKLQTFVGHTNSVKSLYIFDNENSFMSGSRDKTVKLWSLRSQGDGSATSSCQWTYAAHKKSILSLTFVDSLRLVASCDSVVHLWDPFMGAVVAQLDSSKFTPVNVVKSMPSPSSLIFSANTEGTVKVIDGRLANYVYDLKITLNPSGLIRCLAISPSGNWVAAGQSSGNITVLDTRTGLILSSWRAHEGEVLQVVAVNNELLVSSSLDQTIIAWNVNDGKKHHIRSSSEPAHCLSIYEGREIISATTGNRVGIHSNISTDALYSSTKLRGDTFKGLLTSMSLLPLNKLLLFGADNGQISLLC